LERLRAIVDDVACYRTVPEVEDLNGSAAQLEEGGAEWITFTSASTVENFHARFNLPQLVKKFPELRLATIGPETTKALTGLGLTPTVEAKEHHIPGLVHALLGHRFAA
jgi:uroporphyrinogen III methyltransferase/synthase